MATFLLVLMGMTLAWTVVLRIYEERQSRELMRKVSTVLDVVTTLADTWGQSPEGVKGELQKVLHGRRKTDPPARDGA